MLAHIEPLSELDVIVPFLADCGLPVSDISQAQAPQFFGIRSGSVLVAVVGLELFGSVGLLRSLAVSPAYRGRGLAQQLVAFIEQLAASRGVDTLFLLTTTAATFFGKLGFEPVSRSAAPPAICATPQFSGLCPASSAFLGKSVAGLPDHSTGPVPKAARAGEFNRL